MEEHKRIFMPVLDQLIESTEGIRNHVLISPYMTVKEGQGGFFYDAHDVHDDHVDLYYYVYAKSPWRVKRYQMLRGRIDNETNFDHHGPNYWVVSKLIMNKLAEESLLDAHQRGGWQWQHLLNFRSFTLNSPVKSNKCKEYFDLENGKDILYEEVKMLRKRVLELELRPPELGGPGYENAREHFENAL